MYCSMCGTLCGDKALFCTKCGAKLTKYMDNNSVPLEPKEVPWRAVGKLTVIRCPVSKKPERYEGNWNYDSGVMSRRVMFKKQVVNLRSELSKVEIAPEFIAVLAGYRKATELTPGYVTVLHATPLLAEAYQERKRNALAEMILAIIQLKSDWFYAYTSGDIYAELLRNGTSSDRWA
jgi:hypothetical protein